MRPEKTVSVQLRSRIYFELLDYLHSAGDQRPIEHIMCVALREWQAKGLATSSARGFQWKELFLPDGCELRMRYGGDYYYAKVEGDELVYEDCAVSPHGWALAVTGTVRNAWRDIWIRRSVEDLWTRATTWRKAHSVYCTLPGADRRRQHRRRTD